jgi:hypothetical protein
MSDELARRPSRAGEWLLVPLGGTLREIQSRVILAALRAAGGDKTKCARSLDISSRTVYRRLREVEDAAGEAGEARGAARERVLGTPGLDAWIRDNTVEVDEAGQTWVRGSAEILRFTFESDLACGTDFVVSALREISSREGEQADPSRPADSWEDRESLESAITAACERAGYHFGIGEGCPVAAGAALDWFRQRQERESGRATDGSGRAALAPAPEGWVSHGKCGLCREDVMGPPNEGKNGQLWHPLCWVKFEGGEDPKPAGG